MEYRRRLADDFRHEVLAELARFPGAVATTSTQTTREALHEGVALIVSPRLPDDPLGTRRASAHALVRLGRRDDRFVYAPVLVKNAEVVESSSTRSLRVSSLQALSPVAAEVRTGVGLRSTLSVTRSGIALAHATRVLQSLGHGDELARVALVDRKANAWWLELGTSQHPRFNLATYDALFAERRALVDAFEEWRASGGDFPTTPYWHRECAECVYRDRCRDELEERDDVSLTHYTNFEQQRLLHEFGVHTRADLARLERLRVARGGARSRHRASR